MLAMNNFRRNVRRVFFGISILSLYFVWVYNAQAYVATVDTPDAPYKIKQIEATFDVERWYLGALVQFPQMYGFSLSKDTIVPLSLRIPSDTDIEVMRPTLLLVKIDSSRGVEEIKRVDYESTLWQEEKDAHSGFSYYTFDSPILSLSAGEYRIEISSVNNEGKYMLVVGSDDKEVSASTIKSTVRTLEDFYKESSTSATPTPESSSLTKYYPLGILLLLGMLVVVWRYRARR